MRRVTGVSLHPVALKLRTSQGGRAEGAREEWLLGKEQDMVPCAPGNTHPQRLNQDSFLTGCSRYKKGLEKRVDGRAVSGH